MPASFVWQPGPNGGTPTNAANLNRLALTADIGTAGTPTGDAIAAAIAAIGGGKLTPTATKTATYTAAVGDLAVMNVAGGATTLTLPTAPADKAQVGFLAIGATTATPLTVNRGGATDTLGTTGATSVAVPLSGDMTVYQYQASSTRWLPIANVKPLAALDGRYDAAGAATAAQAAAVQRANHTGTQSADTLTDGTTNKAFLATERTKLTGIATGATANSTDAQLRDRSTHTGTQPASTVTGLATVATSGAYSDLSGPPVIPSPADYVVTVNGSTVTATPRSGSGLGVFTGTDPSAVIQSAITALTPAGATGTGGGHIHIARGQYNLTTALTITGWEGNTNPYSQILLTGDGYATQLIQNTAGNHALVVKNAANFGLRDLRIFAGASAKACLLGDDTGTSEISSNKSVIDNVSFDSNSTTTAAVYLKNFFDLSVPSAHISGSANDGLVIENTSAGTHYGNSHFGFLRCIAATTTPYAGLRIIATGAGHYPNQLTFDNYECNGAYYGLYLKGPRYSHFGWVDLEANQFCVYFDGTNGAAETRHVNIADGYMLPRAGGTAVTAVQATGGNQVTAFLDGSQTLIADAAQYRPANTYDIAISGTDALARTGIINASTTPYRARQIDGSVVERLPDGALATTPTAGDSSTKIATTAFVSTALLAAGNSGRISSWQAMGGNSTAKAEMGITWNYQGTATARATAGTSTYTRWRRLGYVGATTANARAGLVGNINLYGTDGYTVRFVFGLPAYNAAHSYAVGLTSFDDATTLPGSQTAVLHMYANPGDTTWKIGGGSGSPGTAVDLGANFPVNTSATDIYDLTFTVAANGTTASYTVKRVNTGDTASGTYSSIPSTGTGLSLKAVANGVASAVAPAIDVDRVIQTTSY